MQLTRELAPEAELKSCDFEMDAETSSTADSGTRSGGRAQVLAPIETPSSKLKTKPQVFTFRILFLFFSLCGRRRYSSWLT